MLIRIRKADPGRRLTSLHINTHPSPSHPSLSPFLLLGITASYTRIRRKEIQDDNLLHLPPHRRPRPAHVGLPLRGRAPGAVDPAARRLLDGGLRVPRQRAAVVWARGCLWPGQGLL